MENIKNIELKITGMSCVACSSSIEASLKRKAFIKSIKVHLLEEVAVISYDSKLASKEQIISFIAKLGYKAEDESSESKGKAGFLDSINLDFLEIFLTPKQMAILSFSITFIVLYVSMLKDMFNLPLPLLLQDKSFNAIFQLILTLSVMHIGRKFYINGIKALISLHPNMDSLVAIGTLASFLYSLYVTLSFFFPQITTYSYAQGLYYEGVCVILSFVGAGKVVELDAKSYANTKEAELLSKISNLVLLVNEKTKEVKEVLLSSIKKDDVLKIMPNTLIPVDGILLSPNAFISQALLSGESLPFLAKKDSKLLSGSLNIERPILLKVSSSAKDSTLTKINDLIKQARRSKVKIARLADVVSFYFVPFVIFISFIGGAFWWWQEDSFYFGMNVLITTLLISCPCALGLASPMALLFASSKLSKQGLFFTQAKSLESTSKIDVAVFDKTGTLSTGDIKVKKILSFDTSVDSFDILTFSASLEANSEHIIAKAILKYAKQKGVKLLESTNTQSIVGLGVIGEISSYSFRLGNEGMFKDLDLSFLQEEGMLVLLSRSKPSSKAELLGAIVLEDCLKPSSKACIDKMHQLSIKTIILSGDNYKNVQKVAKALNVDEFKASCTPQDKLAFIQDLQDKGHKVMMIGDGVNDASALAKSSIAAVMSNGSDVSLKQADLIVLNNDPESIANAIILARATLKNIKQNLIFSFCYNIICIPIALGATSSFGIWLNPMIASIAMSLSSASVVLNASRLLCFKLK